MLVLAVLCAFISWPATAQATKREMMGKDAHLVDVLKLAKQDQWTKASQKAAGDRLAQDLLIWLAVEKGRANISLSDLEHLWRNRTDWPGRSKLRGRLEDKLSDADGATVLGLFNKDTLPVSAPVMVRYLEALRAGGQNAAIRDIMRDWWVWAGMSPQEQALIYQQYGHYAGDVYNRLRMDRQIERKSYTNARALARGLGGGVPQLAEAMIALKAGSPGVNGLVAQVPTQLQNDPALMFHRLRWRRERDMDDRAIELLDALPDNVLLSNADDWWRERHILARRLIENREYGRAYRLVSAHRQTEGFSFAQAEWLAGWLALRFLNQPQAAFAHFDRLYKAVETPISKGRAAYWAGQASMALGYPEIAAQWHKNAARKGATFYGQRAVDALNVEMDIDITLYPEKTLTDQMLFDRRDNVKIMRAFAKAGMQAPLSAFIRSAAEGDKKPPVFYRLLVELAEEVGRRQDAVYVSRQAQNNDIYLLKHGYPTVTHWMRGIPGDHALFHAIMRQESGFDPEIRSPAGAVGLMQLLPSTAAETARRNKIAHNQAWLTQRPSHNIRLGALYIEQMLTRYDGALPAAIAAYNAGPGRVDRWLKEIGDPRTSDLSWVDWIELLPIYETRNYVQRVSEGYYLYKQILSKANPGLYADTHNSVY